MYTDNKNQNKIINTLLDNIQSQIDDIRKIINNENHIIESEDNNEKMSTEKPAYWIYDEEKRFTAIEYRCSNCNYISTTRESRCPNCGKNMVNHL